MCSKWGWLRLWTLIWKFHIHRNDQFAGSIGIILSTIPRSRPNMRLQVKTTNCRFCFCCPQLKPWRSQRDKRTKMPWQVLVWKSPLHAVACELDMPALKILWRMQMHRSLHLRRFQRCCSLLVSNNTPLTNTLLGPHAAQILCPGMCACHRCLDTSCCEQQGPHVKHLL